MKKENKLTFSVFEAITGYSTQQLSNYKKKEKQELFRFVQEEGESFVLCTNAELKEFQKRKGANIVQAEAERTAESLETFQNSINSLVESFKDNIKRETQKAEEMQIEAIQNINNAVRKMQIDNTNVSNISTTFSKAVEDLGTVSKKITEQNINYKSHLDALDVTYENTSNIISSVVAGAKEIEKVNNQIIKTTNEYTRVVYDSSKEIKNTTEETKKLLQSIQEMKNEIEKERKENYLKKYLLPILIPSTIAIIILIFSFYDRFEDRKNRKLLLEKMENIEYNFLSKSLFKEKK